MTSTEGSAKFENRPGLSSTDQYSDDPSQLPAVIKESINGAKSRKDEFEKDGLSNDRQGDQNNAHSLPLSNPKSNLSEAQALQEQGTASADCTTELGKLQLTDSNIAASEERGHFSAAPNPPNTNEALVREATEAVLQTFHVVGTTTITVRENICSSAVQRSSCRIAIRVKYYST